MGSRNGTFVTKFILLGFPIISEMWIFLFILVFVIYILSITTNIIIIVVIRMNRHLHKPMYFFIGNFSFLEIWYPTVTVPTLLSHLLTENRSISFIGCITQLHFHFSLGVTENLFLAIMAFDRCVAIGNPLHYTTAMNYRVCVLLVLGSWVGGLLSFLFVSVSVSRLHFCGPNEIDHYYCDIAPLIKLSCTDTFLSETYFFILASFVILGCFLLILVSYIYIITIILRFPIADRQNKAFSTCASHLTVVLIFYGTIIFMFIRPARSSSQMNKIVSIFPSLVTPLLNPIIYTLRNREVKDALKRAVQRRT